MSAGILDSDAVKTKDKSFVPSSDSTEVISVKERLKEAKFTDELAKKNVILF